MVNDKKNSGETGGLGGSGEIRLKRFLLESAECAFFACHPHFYA